MVDIQKARLSVFIGFLFLLLFAVVFYLFRAAMRGDVVSRWVLFLIFGTTAIILASFGIGYVILLLTKTEEQPQLHRRSEVSFQRTARHQPGMWIDISQLPAYAAKHQQQQKKTARRSVKKKRR